MESEELGLKKSSKLKWIILPLIILLICGGFYLYYVKVFNNPSFIIMKELSRISNSFDKIDNIDTDKPYRIFGNLKFDIKAKDLDLQKDYDFLNKLDILYNLDISEREKLYNFDFDSKYLDSRLLGGKIIIEKNKTYLHMNDLYDKYILLEDAVDDSMEEISNEDDITMFKCRLESIVASLTDEDFKREKATIKNNDEEISVYKNYLFINETNYRRIFTDAINRLKNNQEYIDAAKKNGKDETDIKESLDEWLAEVLSEGFNGSLEFIIYTKKYTNEFVKLEFVFEAEDEFDSLKVEYNGNNQVLMTVGSESIKIDINDNSYQFTINIEDLDDDIESLTIKLSLIGANLDYIERYDTSKYIDIDKITEDDFNEIYQKLLQNEGINRLLEDYDPMNERGLDSI